MAINNPTPFTETASDGTENEFEITTAPADEGLAGQIVQALFDDETAASEVTYADLDGDGTAETGAADTDGDGNLDAVASDMDGDGNVDAVSVDSDGDGKLDAIAVDSDGDGTFEAAAADIDGDGKLDAVFADEDGDGVFESAEVDTDGDGEADLSLTDEDGDGEFDIPATEDEGLPTEAELSTNSIEFSVGEDGFPITEEAPTTDSYSEQVVETSGGDYSAQPLYQSAETEYSTAASDTYSADTAEADAGQVHADAARDAQLQADEYIAQGDYAAAAEAREVAENEAWAAGDSSMLGSSDVGDLENAAYRQEVAEDYRVQQAEHIAEGDYEAAKEDALNAGYATGDADYMAGGTDHTAQADQDAYNLGNAVSDEKNAEYFADNAQWYAEQGNTDAAQSSMDNAAGYQQSADVYAASADPAGTMYDVDPSSAVASGGGYDMAAVDTGFDAGVDTTAAANYDSGVDDGTV